MKILTKDKEPEIGGDDKGFLTPVTILVLNWKAGGTWVSQSAKRPTSAQVMISRFVSSSPASGSVLTAQSLEPASDSVSLFLSLSAPPLLALCLSVPQINKH